MSGKLIRQIALVVLIVAAAAFCAILWYALIAQKYTYMLVPAVGFTGIYIWVLLVELWGALFDTGGMKKTLSTRYKYWTQKHQWLSWIALLLFLLAMTALCVHLGVHW